MKVLVIFRDPLRGGKSVELIFNGLCDIIQGSVNVEKYVYKDRRGFVYNLRRIWASKADIYHITSDMYWLALFLPRHRVVLTIHDIGHYRGMQGIRKKIYCKWYIQWPTRFAAAITTVSKFTFSELQSILPANNLQKVKVIYNPIPFGRSNSITTPVPGSKIVLQVGTSAHKNCESVVNAFKDLHYTLHIIGTISSKQKALIDLLKIKYINSINISNEEIFNAYQNADLVIFVSSYEGFGMPVIEAQAIGRPVITSRYASLPEIAGSGAHFIDNPNDYGEIQQAIIEILENEPYRNKLIKMGFENIKRFNLELIANDYVNVYRSLEEV